LPKTEETDLPEATKRFLKQQKAFTEQEFQAYQTVEWETLRELSDCVIEHGFAPSTDPRRFVNVKSVQYNLGHHYYRIRKTGSDGAYLKLAIPELRELGEWTTSRYENFAKNHGKLINGITLTSVGGTGLGATGYALHLVPKPAPTATYVIFGLIGVLAVGAMVLGGLDIRKYRQQRQQHDNKE